MASTEVEYIAASLRESMATLYAADARAPTRSRVALYPLRAQYKTAFRQKVHMVRPSDQRAKSPREIPARHDCTALTGETGAIRYESRVHRFIAVFEVSMVKRPLDWMFSLGNTVVLFASATGKGLGEMPPGGASERPAADAFGDERCHSHPFEAHRAPATGFHSEMETWYGTSR